MASAENCPSLLPNFSTMKKLFLFFLCCMMAAVFVSAQSEELILKPGSKKTFIPSGVYSMSLPNIWPPLIHWICRKD